MKGTRALGVVALAAACYLAAATGALSLDTNIGRRRRPLGPLQRDISAPPETVFDVIAEPYLARTPHAMEAKLRVLERGADVVVAEHFTPIGLGLKATTVEAVHFERPSRISFRLVRGPVPYVIETFELAPAPLGTVFTYAGELGADFWALGSWWASVVAARWERAVAASLDEIAEEAERRARHAR
ncbi:MAG: SRPBCC family protein [Acidimicrobiia bacterium]|nr:SRPBCC family protein [Acidimicrobiia bacterium]